MLWSIEIWPHKFPNLLDQPPPWNYDITLLALKKKKKKKIEFQFIGSIKLTETHFLKSLYENFKWNLEYEKNYNTTYLN